VDWQDNASDPKTAVTVLQKQLLSDPTLYVSGVKPQTMAIKDAVARAGLPHFNWVFDAHINGPTAHNNFRSWVSYKIEPAVYLDYVARRRARRVAIAYVQLPHTVEEFSTILQPALRDAGVELYVEPYDFGRSEFKEIAGKIVAFKPDLIILNGFQNDLVGMVRSLRPLGAIADGNVIATYDMLDAAKVLGADEIEGIRQVAPLFETRPDSPSIAAWRQRFVARYGRPPLYTHAFAYDMIGAIRAAASRSPAPSTHDDWIQALHRVDTQGVTGAIRFDDDGDLVTPLEVGVYRGGKLVPDTPAASPAASPAPIASGTH